LIRIWSIFGSVQSWYWHGDFEGSRASLAYFSRVPSPL